MSANKISVCFLCSFWVCSVSALSLFGVEVDPERTKKADTGFDLGLLSMRVGLVGTVAY